MPAERERYPPIQNGGREDEPVVTASLLAQASALVTSRRIGPPDSIEVPWQQLFSSGGRRLNAAQWHTEGFPDNLTAVPIGGFTHTCGPLGVRHRNVGLQEVGALCRPWLLHLQSLHVAPAPSHEEIVNSSLRIPTQDLPMGSELAQLLLSVVLGILDQACDQTDVLLHRLQIHLFWSIGVDGGRCRVRNTNITWFCDALHPDVS